MPIFFKKKHNSICLTREDGQISYTEFLGATLNLDEAGNDSSFGGSGPGIGSCPGARWSFDALCVTWTNGRTAVVSLEIRKKWWIYKESLVICCESWSILKIMDKDEANSKKKNNSNKSLQPVLSKMMQHVHQKTLSWPSLKLASMYRLFLKMWSCPWCWTVYNSNINKHQF